MVYKISLTPLLPRNVRNIKSSPSSQYKFSSIASAAKFDKAFTFHQAGHLSEAEALYREILCLEPKHFDALQLLATIAVQKKRSVEAVDLFDQVLAISPHHPGSHNNRGLALKELKRYEEALQSYEKALALKPDYAEAYFNRGVLFVELKRYEEALISYEHAIAVKPDYAEAHAHRDVVREELKKKENTKSFISSVMDVKLRLRALESLSVTEQRKLQDKQLRDLMRHAWQYSDWWKTCLTAAGYVHDDDGSVFPVLENMAPLLRTDVQEHFEGLRAWRGDWSDKDMFTSTTSGSTGIPVRVEKYRALYSLIYSAVSVVDHEWHGRDAKQTLISLIGEEDSMRCDWGPVFEWLQGSGSVINRSALNRSSQEHYSWLLEQSPVYLQSSPHRAVEIAELLIQQGQSLPLKQIISQAERVTPYQREVCRKAFCGAEIIDRYSCEEVGWLALQCPKHEHFHVMAGTTIIEIVDDHLKPCPVGVAGRVLVTSLHSYAMPIIRYDIGDIAEWGEACDCGIKLPVIKCLWGRRRNLIRFTNGELRPMYFFGHKVADIPIIKEYRLIQHKYGVIDFFVRVDRSLTNEEVDKLRSFFYKFDAEFVVNIREVSVIDWGTGLKREEFIRLE